MSVPSPEHPVRGSCLCGAVTFQITAPFRRANYCHCSRCKKHSGSSSLAQGRVPREGFRMLSGEQQLEVYRPPGAMTKAFCRVCGSSLFGGTWPVGEEVSIRLGALDDDPSIAPQFRTHVASVAPWETLPDDGLPRFARQKPARQSRPQRRPRAG